MSQEISDEFRDDFNTASTVYELSCADEIRLSENSTLFINNSEQIW